MRFLSNGLSGNKSVVKDNELNMIRRNAENKVK